MRSKFGLKTFATFTGAYSEPLAILTGVPNRTYSTLGYKQSSFLGKSTLTLSSKSPLSSVDGRRTFITTAHEEDTLISHINPKTGEVKREAVVLLGTKLNPDGAPEINRVFVTEEHGSIISTTSKETHEFLRRSKPTSSSTKRILEAVMSRDERVVGGVKMAGLGPYFGGNPTVYLPRKYSEQIYADKTLFSSQSIDDYLSTSQEVEKDGPRISGSKHIKLVVNSNGSYRSIPIEDSAFVNSTVHRGMQKGRDKELHPTTCYTPGTGLFSTSKSRIAERHDGSTLQTIAVANNASADVLSHWLLKGVSTIMGEQTKSLKGITRLYSDKGVVETLIAEQGAGRKLAHWGLLATGTPFDMSTITIHRDKEGNPMNVMIHKRTKPWPANESVIEITGPKGERQCVIADSIIPRTGFWRDLTVGKLTTPIMNESIISGSIQGNTLGEIDDPDLVEDMQTQNEKGRFTFQELLGFEAPVSMLASAAGFNQSDMRSRVTMVSTTGEFNLEHMLREHIENDPDSMEYYFCSRASRIMVESLQQFIAEDYSRWTDNNSVRALWNDVTSGTLTFETLNDIRERHGTLIETVLTSSSDIERMNDCVSWAKESNTAKIQAEAGRNMGI